MPTAPQVSTPPRPLVEKEAPNTASIFCFRVTVTSSRHRFTMAAGSGWGEGGRQGGWRKEGRGVKGARLREGGHAGKRQEQGGCEGVGGTQPPRLPSSAPDRPACLQHPPRTDAVLAGEAKGVQGHLHALRTTRGGEEGGHKGAAWQGMARAGAGAGGAAAAAAAAAAAVAATHLHKVVGAQGALELLLHHGGAGCTVARGWMGRMGRVGGRQDGGQASSSLLRVL